MMRPVVAGLPVWTDAAGVTHTDASCKRRAPGMVEGVADGWLCTSCVLVEVVPASTRRYMARERVEKVVYGDWRDSRTRAAVRRRRTLARLNRPEPPTD